MLCKRDLPVLKSAEYGSASSIREAEIVRRLILLTKDLDLQEQVVSLNKQILEQRGSYWKVTPHSHYFSSNYNRSRFHSRWQSCVND